VAGVLAKRAALVAVERARQNPKGRGI